MDSPPGFEGRFQSRVCKLKKSLYGLKQSPRAWFENFTRSVKDQGYAHAESDIILIVYVNDIILTGDDLIEMERLKKSLASSFKIKDLGTLRYFLRMEIARSRKGLVVSQRKYVLDLLKETGMSGCQPSDTPMDPNHKLADIKDGTHVDTARYQKLAGKLIYLAHTRPNIAFSVSVVSQLMHSSYEKNLDAVFQIFEYLKSTPGKGLFFKKGDRRIIEAYTDVDWAGSIINFFLSVKSKYYKDRKSSQEYTGHEQKGAKKSSQEQTQKPYLLPNQVRKSKTEFVLSTQYMLAQVKKIGYEVSFNPLRRGDIILEHQPISSAPKSPKQTQRCCHSYFFALFTHCGSLPSYKGVKDQTRENPASP